MPTKPKKPLVVTNRASLEQWMRAQSREVVLAIAARAALRAAPLVARVARKGLSPTQQRDLSLLTGRIFRALALSSVSAQDPDRTFSSGARTAAGAAFEPTVLAIVAAEETKAAMFATSAAANSAASAAAANPHLAATAAAAVDAFVKAVEAADANTSAVDAVAWSEVRSDIEAARRDDIGALLSGPLWQQREPKWVRLAVESLQAALPEDEDWAVWIDWYTEQLRGGSRDGAREIVFASVPQAEWDKGPAAANAWIREHLPPENNGEERDRSDTQDGKSFQAWLNECSPEVAVAIAARVALRMAPLAVRRLEEKPKLVSALSMADLTSAIYRANALARVAAKYPARANELRAAAENAHTVANADAAEDTDRIAAAAAAAASSAAVAAYVVSADAAAKAATATVYAALAGDDVLTAAALRANRNASIREDAGPEALSVLSTDFALSGVGAISDEPLWPSGRPQWASIAWTDLKAALPTGQDWDVWIDWYEERLRGGSRGEEYEFVFASVPQEEWDKGPAAANAWIKKHLPKPKEGDAKDLAEGDDLKQQAALYAFRLADGRIVVAPEEAKPEDREAAQDFLDESRRKAAEQRERLMRAQADSRLQRTLALLDQRLAAPIGEIRVGLVLSSLRSLESDVRAYATEEGRREHAPDLIAGLDDLAGTVHDFASQFPRSREILANQLALDLVEEPRALDAAAEASESVASAAEAHPELVTGDAPDALREPKESAEGARTIADRAKFVGLRLLTVLNFGRIVAQARDIAVEAGSELRKQAPKAAAGAVIGGASLAIGFWLGESGLKLLLETGAALGAINLAVGQRGGAFDRLLKTYEKVAAKKPAASSQDPSPAEEEKEPPTRKAPEKAAKRDPARRRSNRRARKGPNK